MSVFCERRIRLLIFIFAVFILPGVKAYANSGVLTCKPTKLVVDGTDKGNGDTGFRYVFAFDTEKETLRYKFVPANPQRGEPRAEFQDCSSVVVESNPQQIYGNCGAGSGRYDINLETGQAHERHIHRQCSQGGRNNRCWDETVDWYYQCE